MREFLVSNSRRILLGWCNRDG